jgi:hypothetical protein
MCSGGDGGGETQTTVTQQNPEPWSGIQPYLTQLFSLGQQALQSGAGFPYTGPTAPPLSPYTNAAINAQTQVAGGPMSQLASQLGGANAFALNPAAVMNLGMGAQDVMGLGMNNPYFQQSIQAATRPVWETGRQLFQQQADAAQGAGAYGGARDVMVAGDLARKIGREVGTITSSMASQNYQNVFNQALGAEMNRYNQALDTLGRGLALGPQTLQSLLAPAQVYGQLGAMQDARAQERINQLINQYTQVAGFPWAQLGRYGGVLGMGPTAATGGTSTATTTGPEQGSSLGTALGLGLSGSQLGGALGGALSGGAAGSMAGPIGTGIGAVLGLLSGFL